MSNVIYLVEFFHGRDIRRHMEPVRRYFPRVSLLRRPTNFLASIRPLLRLIFTSDYSKLVKSD